MTHYLAMLQKQAKDIHHSQHGQYEDRRLPHRSQEYGAEEEQ